MSSNRYHYDLLFSADYVSSNDLFLITIFMALRKQERIVLHHLGYKVPGLIKLSQVLIHL